MPRLLLPSAGQLHDYSLTMGVTIQQWRASCGGFCSRLSSRRWTPTSRGGYKSRQEEKKRGREKKKRKDKNVSNFWHTLAMLLITIGLGELLDTAQVGLQLSLIIINYLVAHVGSQLLRLVRCLTDCALLPGLQALLLTYINIIFYIYMIVFYTDHYANNDAVTSVQRLTTTTLTDWRTNTIISSNGKFSTHSVHLPTDILWEIDPVARQCLDMMSVPGAAVAEQVVRMLLLISGIESNPGPVTPPAAPPLPPPPPATTPSRCMEALATLITTAPADIKLYLATWSDANTAEQNLAALAKILNSRQKANAFLEWLWSVDKDHESVKNIPKKEDVVFQCMVAVVNLLPEFCEPCNAWYQVERGTAASLRCGVCRKAHHPGCLQEHIGKLDQLQTVLTGRFVWICSDCAPIHQCTSADVGKRKAGRRRPPPANPVAAEVPTPTNTPAIANTPVIANTQDNLTLEEEPEEPAVGVDGVATATTATTDPADGNSSDNRQPAGQPPAAATGENVPANIDERQKAGEDRPVCKLFQSGPNIPLCQFGMAGRGCQDRHPKLCPTFRKFGSSGQTGCRKGKHCEKGLHQFLCRDSITKLRCDRTNCSYSLHTLRCARPKRETGGEGGRDNRQPGAQRTDNRQPGGQRTDNIRHGAGGNGGRDQGRDNGAEGRDNRGRREDRGGRDNQGGRNGGAGSGGGGARGDNGGDRRSNTQDFRQNQTIQPRRLEEQMKTMSETLQLQQQLLMQVMGWVRGNGQRGTGGAAPGGWPHFSY